MLKIGLTGSEGTRLHDVGKIFEDLGVKVFNADVQLKWLLNYNEGVVNAVKNNLGENYVITSFINPLAFDTDEKFDKLIDLVEFPLFKLFEDYQKKYSDRSYVIFLSSLIFERKWEDKFDSVVNVFNAKSDRISNFSASNNYNLLKCYDLFENEMSSDYKNQKADYVIHDYVEENQLKKQVLNCDDAILDAYFIELKKKSKKLREMSDFFQRDNDLLNNIYAT